MEDTSQLDPSAFQNLLSNSQSSLIPESLITTLTVGFIVINVLTILFFIFYVANMVRKWKVDSAILNMHKDLAEIKAHLVANKATPAPPEPIDTPIQPAEQNRTVATTPETDSSRLS